MKTLYLLRHAKSSWDDPEVADHERVLNKRGRTAAKAMAAFLKDSQVAPEQVLCSTAARARETLELVSAGLPDETKIDYEDGLYGASVGELLERLRALPPSLGSVMVVGHNPGIEGLTMALAGDSAGDRLADGYPTCALASLRVPGAWSALGPDGAELTGFTRPADLG